MKLTNKSQRLHLLPAILSLSLFSAPACYQAAPVDTGSDYTTDYDSEYLTDSDSEYPTDYDSEYPTDYDPVPADTETEQQINYALALDGDGDYVRIPHNALQNLQNEWTIESWFFINETDSQMLPIIRKGDQSISISAYFLYARYSGDLPIAGYGTSSSDFTGLKSLTPLQTGVWNHMAFTFNEGSSEFYINGDLVNRHYDEAKVKTAPYDLIIGAILTSTNTGYFNGLIDEVRISDIARYSADFIPETVFTLDGNTIGLWHFNEGYGKTTADEAGNMAGTLIGDAEFEER